MRNLVLFAALTGGALACREAAAAGGPSLASEASDRAHLDLREERASLIAAGDALSDALTAQGVVAGLGAALSRTVDTHVAVLRRKLGHQPQEPGYIVTVAKVGYRRRE